MRLLENDSASDLVCRGFSRDEVMDATGVDVGYHANSVKADLAGIDRKAYKVAYVREHASDGKLRETLDAYATGTCDSEGTLRTLGVSSGTSHKLITLHELFAGLGLADEFREADRQHRKTSMRRGMIERYGVSSPFQLEEFQEKADRTMIERYGAASTLATGSTLAVGARKTYREHMSDKEFANDVYEKRRKTKRAHGIEVRVPLDHRLPMSADERATRDAARRKKLSDAAHVAQASVDADERERRVEKARETSRERYGVDHHSKTDEFKSKMSTYMSDPENKARIHAKTVETSRDRYGEDYYAKTDEGRRRASESMARRMTDPAYKEHVRAGLSVAMMERWSDPDFVNHMKVAIGAGLRKPEAQDRRAETVRRHKPDGVTNLEQCVHGLLVERFGEGDVVAQWRDSRYPFTCDFYVRSRDLFVEVNAHWTHGHHWFDASCARDIATRDGWIANRNDYYGAAAKAWCERDVAKREAARAAGLNYVVLWDENRWDAELWAALGCPDGHDWAHEHSWLDQWTRRPLAPTFPEPVRGRRGPVVWTREAMWANGTTFYAREVARWDEDASDVRFGHVRAYLLCNRHHYLGRLPGELSDADLVRGMGISGLVRAWSHFDASAMADALERLDVRDAWDPCAGWGERLAMCTSLGVRYAACDVNAAVVDGDMQLAAALDSDAVVSRADAATCDVRGAAHDAVIACPPYGDIERYTDDGAENLSHDDFVRWWDVVVEHSVGPWTRWFLVQANQAWTETFVDVIRSHGFREVERIELKARTSHMNRKGGHASKREHETLVILERNV